MLIYRIEHKRAKVGPYVRGDLPIEEFEYCHLYMPMPHDDFTNESRCKGATSKSVVYGFPNLKKLLDFFNTETLIHLHDRGYRVKTFSIDDSEVFKGKSNKQVAFKRKGNDPISIVNILEYV